MQGRRGADAPSAHLITVFDASPSAWAHQALEGDRGLTLRDGAAAVCAFVRAFHLLAHGNKSSFLAINETGCEYLFPPRRFSCHVRSTPKGVAPRKLRQEGDGAGASGRPSSSAGAEQVDALRQT